MVFIVILSSVLLAVCTSLKPIYLQNAIDAVEAGADGALTLFGFYVASILGIMLFETVRQLSTGKYRNSVLFGLKKKVMAHIIHMPPRKFQEEQGQNYVTTLNNEIEMLVDSYYVTRLELAYSILVLITCVIALLYINSSLALIIVISTVCPIIASAVQGKALEKRTNFYTMALEKMNVMIGNLIHGCPTIKVNHVEREYLQTLEQDNENAAHVEFAKSKTKVRVNMIIGLLSYAGEGEAAELVAQAATEGRVCALEFDKFWFVDVYTPNAQNELARIDVRMAWDDAYRGFLSALERESGKPVVTCGDFNVAHEEIDLKNPKSNRGNAGFSDEERGKFTELLNAGFTDTWRAANPDVEGVYSWWSYRFNARKNNAGWRIDYFLVSDAIADNVRDTGIRGDIFGSDHCPVTLTLEL